MKWSRNALRFLLLFYWGQSLPHSLTVSNFSFSHMISTLRNFCSMISYSFALPDVKERLCSGLWWLLGVLKRKNEGRKTDWKLWVRMTDHHYLFSTEVCPKIGCFSMQIKKDSGKLGWVGHSFPCTLGFSSGKTIFPRSYLCSSLCLWLVKTGHMTTPGLMTGKENEENDRLVSKMTLSLDLDTKPEQHQFM